MASATGEMNMHDVLRSWLRASHGGCGSGGWGSEAGRHSEGGRHSGGGRHWAGGFGHAGHHGQGGEEGGGPEPEGFGGSFGVRRPLRFRPTSWSWTKSRSPSWPASSTI